MVNAHLWPFWNFLGELTIWEVVNSPAFLDRDVVWGVNHAPRPLAEALVGQPARCWVAAQTGEAR
jgi:hypothetical protein